MPEQWNWKMFIRTPDFVGEDDFEILEASLHFSRLGLFKEAIQILEEACIKPVSQAKQNHLILKAIIC